MVLQPQTKDQYNFLGEYIQFIKKKNYPKIADHLNKDKILTIMGDTKARVWWIEKTSQDTHIPNYLYNNIYYYMKSFQGHKPLF